MASKITFSRPTLHGNDESTAKEWNANPIQDSRFEFQNSRFKIQDLNFKIQESRIKNAGDYLTEDYLVNFQISLGKIILLVFEFLYGGLSLIFKFL